MTKLEDTTPPAGAPFERPVMPAAWAMLRNDGIVIDVISPAEHERHAGAYTEPLYDQEALDAERERCAKLRAVAEQVLRDMQAQDVLLEWQTLLEEVLKA